MKSKEKNFLWNNMNGTMIFLLILSEILYAFQSTPKICLILKTVCLFHIPILVFVSGYLTKNEENDNKLVLFYLIGNFILMWSFFLFNNTNFNLLIPYYSLWYLLSLFMWKKSIKTFNSIKLIFPFSVLIALLVGFFKEIDYTLALTTTICFFPFFILGYKMNNKKINKLLNKKNFFLQIICGIFLLLTLCVLLIKFVPNISFSEIIMFSFQNRHNLITRGIIFIIAAVILLLFLLAMPKCKIPFISTWGKNNIYIITYHGILVLITLKLIPIVDKSIFYLFVSSISTFIICLICGNNKVKQITQNVYNKVIHLFTIPKAKFILTTTALLFIVLTLATPTIKEKVLEGKNVDSIYPIMSEKEEKEISDSVSLLFAGDLILMKEQVQRGYNSTTQKYEFDSIFQYAKKYISSADLAIGVFEGPMAGEKEGYTTSNYNDGTELHLSFPDEFGKAVKNAGFDLVTLANNHILDKGKKAAYRTIDVLDKLNLKYVGASKNNTTSPVILDVKGLKIGVLAYTYGFNYYTENEALQENFSPLLVDKKSINFSKVRKSVEKDFKNLKKYSPDVIVVLPHMGTQFSNTTDSFQNTWNEIFIENGANIILGDHSHSVQPIEYKKNKDGDSVIIVNSPGNFINSYRDNNGDATAMVKIYLNRKDASILGSSIIPMWTNSPSVGNYQALPVYDILNDKGLQSKLSNDDLERVNEVYNLTTKVMIHNQLSMNNVEKKLYYSKTGYKRKQVSLLNITSEEKNSELYKKINNAKSILFMGDSITEGTKNGGYAWYEPLMNNFKDKNILNVSQGGATVQKIIDIYQKETADLYVIAIGTNDIRYRDKKICAMTSAQYITNLQNLINKIPNNKSAEFVFIAPWLSMSNDTIMTDEIQKNKLMKKYSQALLEFCQKQGYLYIDPNNKIKEILEKEEAKQYLVDYIHPNMNKGIYLYSKAVLDKSILNE